MIVRPVEQRAGAVGRGRVHRPAGDLQQPRRLDLHLHHQGVPEPVSGRAAAFGNHVSSRRTRSASIGVTLVVLVLLYVFFRFTPLGLAMRAAAQNPVSSRLVGIRVGWMLALGWGLAAAIGAVAGMMVAPIVYPRPEHDGRHPALCLRRRRWSAASTTPAARCSAASSSACWRTCSAPIVIGNELKLDGRAGADHRRAGGPALRPVRQGPRDQGMNA